MICDYLPLPETHWPEAPAERAAISFWDGDREVEIGVAFVEHLVTTYLVKWFETVCYDPLEVKLCSAFVPDNKIIYLHRMD